MNSQPISARARPIIDTRASLVGLCQPGEPEQEQSIADLSLAEFCQQYETVELWFDTQPNAQLQLIWLLDYFRSYPETAGQS